MKKTIVLLLVLLLGISSFACASAAGEKTKIAAFLPLTGDSMQYGEFLKNGADYAVADFNAANGTNYTIEYYDDKGDATEAVNVANKIVSDPDVLFAYGSFSSTNSLATANVFKQAEMVQVSPTSSHADFFELGNTTISFACKSHVEVNALAEQLRDNFDLPDTAVIYQNTDHGVMTNEVFTESYTAMGGKVVLSENFVPGSTKDFSPLLAKIKDSGAEAIYLSTNYSDGAMIVLQAGKLGIEASYFGMGSLFADEFVELVGTQSHPCIPLPWARASTPIRRTIPTMRGS